MDIFALPINRSCVEDTWHRYGNALGSLSGLSCGCFPSSAQPKVLTWHTHSIGMEADEEVTDVSFRSGRLPSGSFSGSVITLPWRRQLEK